MPTIPEGWEPHSTLTRADRPRPQAGDYIYLQGVSTHQSSHRGRVGGVYLVRRAVSSLRDEAISIWDTDFRFTDKRPGGTDRSTALDFLPADWCYVQRKTTPKSTATEGDQVLYTNTIRVKNGHKGQVLARNTGTSVQDRSTDLIVWESPDTFTDVLADDNVTVTVTGTTLAEKAAQNRIDRFLTEAFATP